MTEPAALFLAFGCLVATYTAVWLVQRRTRNAGMIDPVWAFSLGALAALYGVVGNGSAPVRIVVAIGGLVWGVRLGSHLWRRNSGQPEDARYRALRESWGENADARMFGFFMVQAVAALILSLGFLIPAFRIRPLSPALLVVAVAIWCVSVGGEAVADRQLRRFVAEPTHRGKVCNVGLWRYSRHPNYFFECLHWVAYVPLAIGLPWGWITLVPPVLMSWLLLKVSGIPILEEHLSRSRPGYAEYMKVTPMLIPWLPRRPAPGRTEKGAS
ncbi:MAG TPA: DUF1295 domain-containing protein [Moraxellaceae bacterium]|nr:DUF1295 domain-containing protein [Moraxellaceae bacterium]